MARSVHGFISEDEGWVDWFMGSWRELVSGRSGSIDLWVRGFMARSHHRVERTRMVIWPVRSQTWRPDLSLSLSVCASVSPFSLSLFLSLRVFENDLKVKQKLKIFSGLKGLFYGQSKWFSRKLYFPYATKHTISCKMISWNRFQPKQTQP